ncbi:glutamate receptor ionotropic, delta-2 isoform X1 [Nasonia vitripennis]|uniref:Uncharacterized protein n=1 Tax=Nasonia vitripennis TaxID=7425 RepID=A0A7M7QD42_NASVI|nr:glutamate receptor ionotropic, delta-2 isoform X1 [Nasonia vitripennis]
MWRFCALIFISLGILVDCHEIDELISNLVAEASAGLFFPAAAVGALLCTKTENAVEFSKILSKNHVLNNQLNYDDFEENIVQYPVHQTTIFLDYDCPRASEALRKANNSGLFSAPIKWLILQDLRNAPNENCTETDCILNIFHDYAMFPDSEILIFERTSKNYVKILSVYRPSPVRDMMIEDRGFWSKEDGLKMKDAHVSSRRRRNLYMTPLKSSIVVTNPDTLNHLTDYRDEHVDTITKCNYVWLHHLVAAMNATVTYNVVNSWGYRDKNGSWNGMMGMLSRKEIDIGGTSMFLVGDRWADAHYIPLSTPTRAAFIFRQPPLSFVSNLFTLPFRPSVWIAIGILLIIIFLSLVISTKWEWVTKEVDSSGTPPPSLSDNLLLVVGAIAQQGFGRNPRTVPSRIVLLMLLLAALNLYASYSANIVALLQSTTTSIQTLRDLLDSPIKCGAQDIVYNRYYFNLEKDPVRRGIIDHKIEPKGGKSNWMSADDGIKNIRQGFFAFFMETGPGYKIIQETFEEDEKCGFREMYFIEHFDPMFTIVKQSPYVEIMRVNSLKIEESGLKSREMSKFYTKRPPCNGLSKFISVGLNECYFAFYTMGYGALIAFVVLFAEFAWMKSTAARRKNKLEKIHYDESLQSFG